MALQVLYADVERWNKYQANLKELERCEGKKLWLAYDAERGEYDRRNDEWKSKKADMKEAEAEKKALTDKAPSLAISPQISTLTARALPHAPSRLQLFTPAALHTCSSSRLEALV